MTFSSDLFTTHTKLPELGEFDVVVVGGGPGGLGAAVAAARQGSRTALIEKQGFGGGTATQAFVGYLMGFTDGSRQIIGGVADELVRLLDGMGEAAFRINPAAVPDPRPIGSRPLVNDVLSSIEGVKVGYNRLLREAGVSCLFYSSMIGCIRDDRRILSVVVNNIETIGKISGTVFIDATGDAHVVHRAGGEVYEIPAESAMTKTIFAHVGGVERFYRPECERIFSEQVKNSDWPIGIQDRFMSFRSLHAGEIYFHVNAAVGDALNSSDMTRMDQELREQIFSAIAWFRRKMPGFANAYVIDAGSCVGVRAGRCIVGRETVTAETIADEQPTATTIAMGTRSTSGAHYIKHFKTPWESKPLSGLKGIPLGSVIPVSFDNVAVAGRCLSHKENVSDSFRTMARCIAIGEGAGVVSAISATQGIPVPAVPYQAVREALLANQAILDERDCRE